VILDTAKIEGGQDKEAGGEFKSEAQIMTHCYAPTPTKTIATTRHMKRTTG